MVDTMQLYDLPASHQAQIEFIHETAHWLTEAKTSIGQFLVFLKGTRDQDLVAGLITSPVIKELYSARLAEGSNGKPIVADWVGDKHTQITGEPEDDLLNKWLWNYKAEALLLHHTRLPMRFDERICYLCGAIEEYSAALNEEKLLNNPAFGARQADAFIRNSIERHYQVADCIDANLQFETVDLIEAVAVCAEFLWASRHGILPSYGPTRLQSLRATAYLQPIEAILRIFGETVTLTSTMKFIKLIIMVLDCALNPPIPPIENFKFAEADWSHLFPPMRFKRALWAIDRPGFLDSFAFDTTYDQDADWQLQLFIYQAIDPPGRNFGMRIVENSDFDAFLSLPDRPELENMFVWTNNGRLLTPYFLRLWSANQFRVVTGDAGLPDLTRCLLAPDLRLVSAFCEPVLTIRSQAIFPGSATIPANSQFLNRSDALEWFMVLSGVQYAGADFLISGGTPNLTGYIQGNDFERSEWLPQLRARSEALLESILSVGR